MSIRQKKSTLRSIFGRESFKKIDKTQLIKLLIVAGAVIAAVIVIAGLVARGNIDSSFIAQAETVRVGIRTDIAGFGDIGESGDIEGFDADVAKEVVARVLTEEKPITLVPLTSEDAGAGIKYDQIDIAIGFLVPGTARVSGFTITDPYYTDTVYAAVADPAITSLSALDGKAVGILNSMIPLATANDYLDDLNISAEITRYFSLEEAIAGLETGKIDAFLAPGAFLNQYMPSYARIGEPVAQIGYGILLPSSQSLMQGEMNDAIRSMKRDGTLENLAEKWGIPAGG